MVVSHQISDSQRVLILHPCASTFHKGLTSFKGLANKKDLDYCFYAWFSRCFICSSQRPNIFLKGGAVREGHRTDLSLGRCMNIFLLQVFKMGLFGPEFVWILHPNAGNIDLWVRSAEIERRKNRSGLCSREQYQQVAERIFILDKKIIYRSDENTTTASGLVRVIK